MRLWSIHPRYLDAKGLVALWREALLAQAVLRGQTKGYTNHPQLYRFREHENPVWAVSSYLESVHAESVQRGYRFDATKISAAARNTPGIALNNGQLAYEWQHLLTKLSTRSPEVYARWKAIALPEPHPFFRICEGPRADWEKTS